MEEEAEEMVPAAWAEGALPARAVAVAMVAMAVVAVVAAAMAVEARGVRAVRDIPLPRCAVRERAADRGQREVGGEGACLPAHRRQALPLRPHGRLGRLRRQPPARHQRLRSSAPQPVSEWLTSAAPHRTPPALSATLGYLSPPSSACGRPSPPAARAARRRPTGGLAPAEHPQA